LELDRIGFWVNQAFKNLDFGLLIGLFGYLPELWLVGMAFGTSFLEPILF